MEDSTLSMEATSVVVSLSPDFVVMEDFVMDTYQSVESFLHQQDVVHLQLLWPTLLYLAVVMVMGLLGNVLVLLVYYKRMKASATRTFILAISAVDLATVLISLPADVIEIRYHNTFRAGWACKLARTVKSWLGFTSACLLVAVALDRHRTVCNPRASRASNRCLTIALGVCGLIALVVTIPYTMLTGCQTVTFPTTNITGYKCSIEDRYVGSLFLLIYDAITALAFVTCVVVMIVCYVKIARQLWRHKKNAGAAVSTTGMAMKGNGDQTFRNPPETHTYVDEETSVDRTEQPLDSGPTVFRNDSLRGNNDNRIINDNRTVNNNNRTDNNDNRTVNNIGDQVPVNSNNTTGTVPERPNSQDNNVPYTRCDGAGTVSVPVPDTQDQAGTAPVSVPDSCDKQAGTVPKEETPSSVRLDGGENDPDSSTGSTNSHTCLDHVNGTSSTTPAKNGPNEVKPHMSAPNGQREVLSSLSSSQHVNSSVKLAPAVSFTSIVTIATRIRRKSSSRLRKGSVRQIPTRTTLMMFVLTAVFVVNYLPYLVVTSARIALGLDSLVHMLTLNGYHVLLRSYFVNSAVNAIVYGFCSLRFRRECRKLLTSVRLQVMATLARIMPCYS